MRGVTKKPKQKRPKTTGDANDNDIDGRTTRTRAGRRGTRRTTNRDRNHNEQGQEPRRPQMTTEGVRRRGRWDDEGTRHPPPPLRATARRVDSGYFDDQRTPQRQRRTTGGTITQDNNDTHGTRRTGRGEKRAQMTMESFAPQVIFCMFVYLFFC
jgi:hypothetical protein